MKKHSSKTEKTFIDEFTDYIESVYEPEGDYDSLSEELLKWEYERFLEMIAK
jgi:hypothetical protein